MSKHRSIEQVLLAAPGWRLVVQDRSNDCIDFRDVACWALVSFGDRRRVVPMFAPPYDQSGALAFLDPDDDDVVGIAQPGDDARAWEEQAEILRSSERDAEDRKEEHALAQRLADVMTTGDVDLLREMARDASKAVDQVASAAGLVVLTERGLVGTYRASGREIVQRWYVTPLGRAVLAEVDRRSR